MLYIIVYLFFMVPTYCWRLAFISQATDKGGIENIDTTPMYIAMIVNYLILIYIAYRRSKTIDKPVLTAFPIIASVFDIVIAFIPFIPTVMNVAAIIVGAQNKSNSKNESKIVAEDNSIDKLEKLAKLKESGAITEEEFAKEKEKLMKNI